MAYLRPDHCVGVPRQVRRQLPGRATSRCRSARRRVGSYPDEHARFDGARGVGFGARARSHLANPVRNDGDHGAGYDFSDEPALATHAPYSDSDERTAPLARRGTNMTHPTSIVIITGSPVQPSRTSGLALLVE